MQQTQPVFKHDLMKNNSSKKEAKKGKWKKRMLTIHGWLGLSTGLVVFIVSITGCCWVFKEEIEGLIDEPYAIEASDKPIIPPSQAEKIAQEIFPKRAIHGALYQGATDPIEVIFYEADPEFYQMVYLHPYTGEVLGVKNGLAGFFAFVLKGHLRLWLPAYIGSHIVTISVLLFLFILFTGIILWAPKKVKTLKQRLRFLWKTQTGWRRKNFDLHAITGFYIYLLAFTLAFTGCVMGFNWFYYIVYKSVGGDNAPQFIMPVSKSLSNEALPNEPPIDQLMYKLFANRSEDITSYEFHYPENDTTSIYVEVAHQEGVYYNSDYRFFDQYSLEELPTSSIYGKYADASFADKVIRMNYDIHIGAIGGLPGKILAFLVSLISASLPVTGTLLWWGRKAKAKRQSQHLPLTTSQA